MRTKSPRKERLPRYVQAIRNGFRGWWMDCGVRFFSKVYPTAEEAHEFAVAKRKSLARPEGRLTLQGGIDLVREDLALTNARPGTFRWYEDQFAVFLRHWTANSRLEDMDVAEVEWFIGKRLEHGVSPNSVLHHLRALGRIFRLANTKRRLDHNPVDGVRKPKAQRKVPDVFTWAEALDVEARVREVAPEDADLVRLLLYTGLRRAEAARLQVQPADEFLRVVGKTGHRNLPIPGPLKELLHRMRDKSSFVVAGSTEDLRVGTVARVLQRWQGRLPEKRLHAHTLRHTFASRLAELGVPRYVLADLMGHGRRADSITDRYITAFGAETSRAMELLWTGESWYSELPGKRG
ncbi:MAG: tyrosine-type recombinase/integrase [Planctomycetota bacterium]